MSRKTLLAPLLVAAVLAVGAAAKAPAAPPHLRKAPAPPPLVEPVETTAAKAPAGPPVVEVLRAWDVQRARAWARGDERLLRSLYTPGSEAGGHDRAMLRAWLARGMVVRGMRTQLLEVREVRRTASIWTLVVTDRLMGGLAVGTSVRRSLPRDAPTTRTVELRRVSGSWLVSAVEPLEPSP
jgi:hypothetical protein